MEKTGTVQGSPIYPFSPLPTPYLSLVPRCLAAGKNPSLDWLLCCTELPSLGIIFKIRRHFLEDYHTFLRDTASRRLKGTNT